MDAELTSIVNGLDGKSARTIDMAWKRLLRARQRRRADLIALLHDPAHSTRTRYVSGYGPVKQLVWRALLRPVTSSILRDIAFVARDPDDHIRAQFACDLAETGKRAALTVVARAMRDREESVREWLVMGMRDATRNAGPAYRRAAVALLRTAPRSLHTFGPYMEAMERYARSTRRDSRRQERQ